MNFSELKKIADIEYFEFPMLSLFVDTKKQLYLWNWVDVSENSHLWLVFEISPNELLNYLSKKIDQRTLISANKGDNYYLVETSNQHPIVSQIISKKDIFSHEELIPDTGFFFKNEYCQDYDKILNFLNQHKRNSSKFIMSFMYESKAQNSFKTTNTYLYGKQPKYF